MATLNLNADLGESWYDRRVGNDTELMPLLDSCNIACGFHGGDALTMQRTIELALRHNVAIGAHPSFPDRKNFGRQRMELPLAQLKAMLLYQVSALQGMVRASGAELHHIKPHGALYHYLNEYPLGAEALVEVALALGVPRVYGPPEGALRGAVAGAMDDTKQGAGLVFWAEGFADRAYEPDLKLRSRSLPGATIDDPKAAAEQVRLLAMEQVVVATDGKRYPLAVDTVCIHGDHAGALSRARAVRAVLG
ncbi:MAG: 5-oxoprolinase subunit PxpA [Bacteroidota bacterium]